MKKILIAALLLVTTFAWSDKTAVTEDGSKVLLRDDGTWTIILELKGKGQDRSDYDFRNTQWGMCMDEVKQSEKAEFFQGMADMLVYKTTIANLECLIGYIFFNQKLCRTKYIITQEHSNRTEYVNDYRNLAELLKKKYGDPDDDITLWKDKLYKDDPDDWGMAIAIGHLVFQSVWNLENTKILLTLQGDNYDITLNLEYQGTELTLKEQKSAQQQSLDEL